MHKRLQVFISSTYKDLLPERQAAVEAILGAGHIPAGMELFAAGSDSQLNVVKRWIDQSDVYLLILGGRYGSIEPKSGKSYTQIEYEYAVEKGVALFAVVADDGAIEKKVKKAGRAVVETENAKALQAFRTSVLSRMVKFFVDPKDIKLAIHETLAELQRTHTFSGWVSGKDAQQPAQLLEQLSKLMTENEKLRAAGNARAVTAPKLTNGRTFEEILSLLKDLECQLPPSMRPTDGKATQRILDVCRAFRAQLALGITNQSSATEFNMFLFGIAQELLPFGLTERAKVPNNVYWSRLATSKAGNEFLTELEVRLQSGRAACAPTQPAVGPTQTAPLVKRMKTTSS